MATTEQRCTALEQRFTALDTQIDKFKFIVKFLIGVAAALGISVPVAYVHFMTKYDELQKRYESVQVAEQGAESKIKALQEHLAAVTELEAKIQLLKSRADVVEQKVNKAKQTAGQIDSGHRLQEDVLQFESSPPSQTDAWSAYTSDLQSLKSLAVRYVGFVATDIKEDSNHALNKDLQNAAEALRSRVRLNPSTDAFYKWHVTDTPTNFENLLTQFAKDQDSAQLTPERLACYKQAFPVWLDMVGVHESRTLKTSDECKVLLRLSD